MSGSDRLSSVSQWDQVHVAGAQTGGRRRYLRAMLGEQRFQYLYEGGYAAYFERERLIAPHVTRGANILEVGSAPGLHIAKLARSLELEPWGLDYSEVGVRENRATFARFGFDPENVIHGDFFDDAFIEKHRGRYDAVISRGFIEHFRDVRAVVARHAALVRPGGLLMVTIPNFSGLNLRLAEYFDRRRLDSHNLDIMHVDAYEQLFAQQGLAQIYCGYVGVFHTGLQAAPADSPKQHLLRIAQLLQGPLELLQKRWFATRSPQVPWLSPYLAYAGRVER